MYVLLLRFQPSARLNRFDNDSNFCPKSTSWRSWPLSTSPLCEQFQLKFSILDEVLLVRAPLIHRNPLVRRGAAFVETHETKMVSAAV